MMTRDYSCMPPLALSQRPSGLNGYSIPLAALAFLAVKLFFSFASSAVKLFW